MLPHPTQERLLALRLTGMAKALDDQRRHPPLAFQRLRRRNLGQLRPTSRR
jgi:hypothetical protein